MVFVVRHCGGSAATTNAGDESVGLSSTIIDQGDDRAACAMAAGGGAMSSPDRAKLKPATNYRVAVRARRLPSGEKKVVKPQMLVGYLLQMAVGGESTPKGGHPADLAARAAMEVASACGLRSHMKRRKGKFGYGAYADESWSLQAFQKRVYAVRDVYGVELKGIPKKPMHGRASSLLLVVLLSSVTCVKEADAEENS